MKKIIFQKDILPHLIALAVFLIITLIFFQPVFFEQKTVVQSDIVQWRASAQELIEYRNETGEEGLWTNSIFGGMPAYLISVKWGNELIKTMHSIYALGLPHPVRIIYVSMLSFYIMLLCFKVRPYLAILGAIAFGFSSYQIIGLTAGHNARISAVSFMPLVLGGVQLCFHRYKWLGAALTALALAMQLRVNHLQITYYLAFILLIYGAIHLYEAYKNGTLKAFGHRLLLLIAAAIMAIGTFFGEFYATYEYGKYSNRGASELSQQDNAEMNSDGLSKSYAFQYSNGLWDPFTLFIPNALGGNGPFPQDSELADLLIQSGANNAQIQQYLRGVPTYWGKESPTTYYAGAIMVFLFVLGCILVERKYVVWTVTVGILGIALSYGRNFPAFNELMFDYFPGYNKFRSVTFTMIMPIFSIGLLGMLGLEKYLQQKWNNKDQKALFIALGSTAGVALLLWLFAGIFSFRSGIDTQLQKEVAEAVQASRKGLFKADSLRATGFILAFGVLLYLSPLKKISETVLTLLLLFLGSIEVLTVSSRFIDDANYQRQGGTTLFNLSQADQSINQQKQLGDRVLDLTQQFYSAQASYHHHLVNGYHGARIRRYQEIMDNGLIDEYARLRQSIQDGNVNFEDYPLLNMMNTKFMIVNPSSANGVITNDATNGAAWFAQDVIKAATVDDVFEQTLGLRDTKNTAIIHQEDASNLPNSLSMGEVELTDYRPGYWEYKSSNSGDGFVVFSEVFYPKGFQVNIDGEPAKMIATNYTLRGMVVPAGQHTITVEFAPSIYTAGTWIMLIMSFLVVISFLGAVYYHLRK